MAKVSDNILTRGLSGSIGQTLTFRQRSGRTFVSNFPRHSLVPPTEKLVLVRMKFASCIAYAKSVVKDPVSKALYQAAIKGGQTAFNVATSDALNPPRITKIHTDRYHGIPGNKIIIEAIDDFKVASVKLSVHNAEGGLVEQGNAILPPGKMEWFYISTVVNPTPAGSKITAVATDLPGNSGSLSLILN